VTPAVVCVIGKKKSGKTTTVVGLVTELTRRGHRVATAKHGHGFRFDAEGTDSWRHRHEGGAYETLMAGPEGFAMTGAWGPEGEVPLPELVAAHLGDAEIVVAEGFKTSPYPRVEVFRSTVHERPYYGSQDPASGEYLAVLTDIPNFEAEVSVLDIDADDRFARLADIIESRIAGGS
jgi:molybdopterin-guanine dinucleotide biosynthesis adapter protein